MNDRKVKMYWDDGSEDIIDFKDFNVDKNIADPRLLVKVELVEQNS
jgi:hypothetical protein